MRPLRLDLEGFTSFAEKQSIDFSDLDLFAITGPTGAGKSSLIDALVFALYGQVPRVGDDYKQLISHGVDRLSVLLEFEAGKQRYRIARTARRTGASKQRLERLEGEEVRPLADRAREIRTRIEEILGLDYDGFTRAVVLPQGQFDQFLTGEPKERRKILVSLLNLGIYDAILKLANQKGRDARQEAGFIAEQLERDFAEATPETLEDRKQQLSRAEREGETVERALESLGEGLALARRLRDARREGDVLERSSAQEEEKRQRAEETLSRGDDEREKIREQLENLDRQRVDLEPDPARQAVLVSARHLAGQLGALRQQADAVGKEQPSLRQSLERARQALAEAEVALPLADDRRDDAEAALVSSRTALEGAHREHAAVALRRELKAGDPCPVCEQTVPTVPKGAAPALDAATKAVESAEKAAHSAARAAQEARLGLQKTQGEVASAEKELARHDERAGELVASVEAVKEELREAGFGGTDLEDAGGLAARVEGELEGLERARRQRAELEKARTTLEEKKTALETRLATAAAQRDGAMARLDEIATRREAVVAALDECRPALEQLASAGGWPGLESGRELEGRADEVDVLEALRGERQEEARGLASRIGALRGEVERIERKIDRAAELRKKRTSLETEGALLKTLADHLRANELVAWIQEEALGRLAEDGSRHLERLSQGRYGLRLGPGGATAEGARAEQDFFVIDRWNADGVRSVKTLSGGETFLASLALALALAESLARLSAGGRAVEALESLFLDEGFGSLDGECLDTVVAALDALHGGQRLVGVITHVRELAERMPARLEVRRAGRAASATVV